MSRTSRRNFVKSTTGGLAASFVITRDRRLLAANEQIQHAVIGTGGQGRTHCRAFSGLDRLCRVMAVCDVDPSRRRQAAQEVKGSSKVAVHEDYRRIIEDSAIDTVSIATPDHWHTKIALEAILAGKHVYVEKPCCHNIHEGKLLAEAAEKYQKCVQHGTQSRSGKGIRDAIDFLRSGKLGKIRVAKAINHQLRGPIGHAPETDPPNGVHYDLWLGPAPKRAFTKNRWHYNWHWFWDYGTGDLGNDGIHQVDVARWGLGVGFPKAVSASGGQLFYTDDHETPDTQVVTFEYDDCYLVYEMRLWTPYKLEGHDNGVVFYGDKGILEVGRNGCEVTFADGDKERIGGGSDLNENVRNFLLSVRADDSSCLNAPAPEAFASATLCHIGNIATRVGRRLHYDSRKHRFEGNSEANKLVTRKYRSGYGLPKI